MMDLKDAQRITGGLSKTSKMPGPSFSISASKCKMGAKLREVKGSVCEGCYALKGHYVYPVVKEAHARRLEGLESPLWVEAIVALINASGTGWHRWHDSGDLQSLAHLEKIAEVCRQTPKIKHWLPTREYAFVQAYHAKHGSFPRNLTVRLSAYMIDGPLPLALAKRLKITVSGVTRDKSAVTCKAYEQGGVCGDCRLCWNPRKTTVMYPKH